MSITNIPPNNISINNENLISVENEDTDGTSPTNTRSDKELPNPPNLTNRATRSKDSPLEKSEETKSLRADIDKLAESIRRVSVALFELQLLLDDLNKDNIARSHDEKIAKLSIENAVEQAINGTKDLNSACGTMSGCIDKLDKETRAKIQGKVDEIKTSLKKLNDITQASQPLPVERKTRNLVIDTPENIKNKKYTNDENYYSSDEEYSSESI